ncbi:MAG TPA: PadR family transcriptional regulator [Trebonia sp.]|jgi:DNA-binding PadR family transcriptional regulator|nr:PadR family transcriptional regulator [Trebonia sp.]
MSSHQTPRRARPLPRTPVALSVLNLLNERPMHPYEMRTMMRERRHDRAFRVRESSVYDTVSRLADRGFIEPVEVNRAGNRPERTVYALTEAGRDELMVWLWELTSEPAAEYPEFAAPLMFIYALGRDRAIAALRQRSARLEGEISANDAFRRAYAEQVPDFPRIFGIEDEYAQAIRKAELAWVRATVAELRDGTFPWPDPDQLKEAGF